MPINISKCKETEKELISRLTSKANSYNSIIKFCETDPRFKEYYNKASERLLKDNCQSVTSMVICAIQDVLDDVEE